MDVNNEPVVDNLKCLLSWIVGIIDGFSSINNKPDHFSQKIKAAITEHLKKAETLKNTRAEDCYDFCKWLEGFFEGNEQNTEMTEQEKENKIKFELRKALYNIVYISEPFNQSTLGEK